MDAIAISTPREGNYSAIANAVTIRVYGQAQEMRRSASLVERNELEWREPADRAPSDPLQCSFNKGQGRCAVPHVSVRQNRQSPRQHSTPTVSR